MQLQLPLRLNLGLRLWVGCQAWMQWQPGNPMFVSAAIRCHRYRSKTI
ncbi:hypothetical protein [Leptolyngbya sp. FACHB-16]|nr:hypothetical protein [Leptolyngbya sp. FACHB-16]